VPPLDIEPEFQSAATAGSHEIDDEPLLVDSEEESVSSWIQRADDAGAGAMGGRSQGFIDLGVEGVTAGDAYTPGGRLSGGVRGLSSIDELESRVADDPDDPDAHRSLGEALIEAGDRERGIEELDLAASGYESAGNVQQAQDLLNEVLRLDPNSVRHRQRVVEYAYRAGDRDQLIEAYLELADALLRNNLGDKAQAVYERVAEHDPHNARAQAALSMLTAPPPTPEGRVPPESARMRVRGEVVTDGDFVDFGAMVLDETEEPVRDTRMKVEDEAPTGDEERDFQEMLAKFKQGIDENIDETDFQSHYDLGVAFNLTLSALPSIRRGAFVDREQELSVVRELGASLQLKARSPDDAVTTLSGGNQQKVVIGKALLTVPTVLLLDEPTRGIDIGARQEIYQLINQLAAGGTAIVMVSSELNELLGMSDRIAVMRGGTIVAMLPGKSDAHEVMAAALGK